MADEDRMKKIEDSMKEMMDWKKAKDESEEKEKKEKEAKDAEEKKDKEEKESMDAAIKTLTTTVETLQKDGFKALMKEAGQRDALAAQLAPFIGVFDHAEMTQTEVAKYGIDKLKITAPAGQELAVLTGFLHGRKPETQSYGMDSGIAGKKGKYAAAKEKQSA